MHPSKLLQGLPLDMQLPDVRARLHLTWYHMKTEFHQVLPESIFWKQVKYLLFVGPWKTN
jgi:hypothetical protein